MSARPARLARAVDSVVAALADPRYAHTSHLHVRVDGRVAVDEHFTGPVAGDVFSVTKSVLATAVGVVAEQGRLPDLDAPVVDVLPDLRGTLPGRTPGATCSPCRAARRSTARGTSTS
jgi:CubicO group peptidase (beta-lactamase class C family)